MGEFSFSQPLRGFTVPQEEFMKKENWRIDKMSKNQFKLLMNAINTINEKEYESHNNNDNLIT